MTDGFEALLWGLSPEEYKDAQTIAGLVGYTRATRAVALQMKYPIERWKLIMDAAWGLVQEGNTMR